MSYRNDSNWPKRNRTSERRLGLMERQSTGSPTRPQRMSTRPFNDGDPDRWLNPAEAHGGASRRTPTDTSRGPANPAVHEVTKKDPAEDSGTLPEALMQVASLRLLAYLKVQRDHYWSQGRGLNDAAKARLGRFFSQELLAKVRVVALSGSRLKNPWFYEEDHGFGELDLPSLPHKASVAYLDLIVFNDRITDRELFQALVHGAQIHILGAQAYSEFMVRGVVRTRSYSLIPLRAQAFALGSRFAANPEHAFSVEAEVRAWLHQGRY